MKKNCVPVKVSLSFLTPRDKSFYFTNPLKTTKMYQRTSGQDLVSVIGWTCKKFCDSLYAVVVAIW